MRLTLLNHVYWFQAEHSRGMYGGTARPWPQSYLISLMHMWLYLSSLSVSGNALAATGERYFAKYVQCILGNCVLQAL